MVLCGSGAAAEEPAGCSLGDSEEAYNGSVAIWPPRRVLGAQPDRAHLFQQTTYAAGGVMLGGPVSLAVAARRSLGGSEASFTESDTCSLRSAGRMGARGTDRGRGRCCCMLVNTSRPLVWGACSDGLHPSPRPDPPLKRA